MTEDEDRELYSSGPDRSNRENCNRVQSLFSCIISPLIDETARTRPIGGCGTELSGKRETSSCGSEEKEPRGGGEETEVN